MSLKTFIAWLLGILFHTKPSPVPVPPPDPIPVPPPVPTPVPDPVPVPDPIPPPPHDERDAIDINLVNWNRSEEEVKTWPIKATMTLCSPDRAPADIVLAYDAGTRWPNLADNKKVNANVHVIFMIDGRYYGGTWEWLRREVVSATWRRHLEVPFDEIGRQTQMTQMEKHRLSKGDKVWFMVSGLCRGGARNVKERTQIMEVTWP